jgi:TonB family protein
MSYGEIDRRFTALRIAAATVLLAATFIKPNCAAAEAGALPSWIRITATHPRADAVAAWRALRTEEVNRKRAKGETRRLAENLAKLSGQSPKKFSRVVEESFESSRYEYSSYHRRMDGVVGEFAGNWLFFGEEYDPEGPTSAFRAHWPIVGPDYLVEVELYCDANDCGEAIEVLMTLQAPEPGVSVELYRQWQRIVAEESCADGPPKYRRPFPPRPITSPMVVMIGLLVNRCGEVRDAWVERTSGDTAVDESAIKAARSWRTPAPQRNDAGDLLNERIVPVAVESWSSVRGKGS